MILDGIDKVENDNGATVYHVHEMFDGQEIIQEFWTIKQAQEYIDYVKELEG